jgi:hypothetical protein
MALQRRVPGLQNFGHRLLRMPRTLKAVIEHLGHMADGGFSCARALQMLPRPQHQVVVFGAFSLRVEAAERLEQIAPDQQQPADIGQAAQIVEIEVRLAMRVGVLTIGGDLVFVGVDDLPLRMLAHGMGDAEQRIRRELVAGVDRAEPVGVVVRQSVVGRCQQILRRRRRQQG